MINSFSVLARGNVGYETLVLYYRICLGRNCIYVGTQSRGAHSPDQHLVSDLVIGEGGLVRM